MNRSDVLSYFIITASKISVNMKQTVFLKRLSNIHTNCCKLENRFYSFLFFKTATLVLEVGQLGQAFICL